MGTLMYRIVSGDDAELPARSLATAVITFGPGSSKTVQEKAPPDTAAATPLHETTATPDSASDTRPDSVNDGVYTVVPVVPVVGGEIVTSGDVMSMLNGSLVTEADWPAESVTDPVTV